MDIITETKEEVTVPVLPNPNVHREAITNELCDGCKKIYENHTLPAGMIPVDVCICYEKPNTKWRNYKTDFETIKKGGKDVIITYHYSPCPMATHIKHTPKMEKIRGRVKRK